MEYKSFDEKVKVGYLMRFTPLAGEMGWFKKLNLSTSNYYLITKIKGRSNMHGLKLFELEGLDENSNNIGFSSQWIAELVFNSPTAEVLFK